MERARSLFPGGVSSPVRAFRGVGGEPFVVDRGCGARIRDVDGRSYTDFVLSWGALLAGHAHPRVVAAVEEAVRRGSSFGAPTEMEVLLGEEIRSRMPHVEMLRFVSSGTEATMSAVRLARAATNRDRILKFEGCYHGHADSFLVKAGSGVATLGLPDSPGVPAAVAGLTMTAPYNDLEAVRTICGRDGDELAAIIVEPVVGNAGLIEPMDGFLAGLREAADETGALLVFDEVMTGFRVAPGGAAAMSGVTPDLTTLGKVIGGGFPVGAYGGREELMRMVAPDGPVYQAGTLSGNPVAMAAGLATLELLTAESHDAMVRRTRRLADGVRQAGVAAGIPVTTSAVGSMWGLFFSEKPVRNFADARRADAARYRRFFHAALAREVFLAPSPFEAAFMSLVHDDAVVDDAIARIAEAFAESNA